jgi:2-amino-4-hydroxy-6-hydroxymethyldihydropteridine diphosphokinase
VPIVHLGIGTNLDDRHANIDRALRAISHLARITRVSRIYESAPVGFAEQPPFWNLVVRASTALPPAELLTRLKEIERSMGRVPTFRNGPRLIDIDILFYDDMIVDDGSLSIPHPRAHERAFVLRPLYEVAPGLVDPRTGALVADGLSAVAEQEASPIDAGANA